MPTPAPQAGDHDVPVNIAPPNWQCPRCKSRYATDLEAATECAQAPVPAPTSEDVPVLVLSGAGTLRTNGVVLDRTRVGPVKAARVDGVRTHQRDVLVGRLAVDPDRLAAAAEARDGLLVLAAPASSTQHRTGRVGLEGYSTMSKLIAGADRYGSHDRYGDVIWFNPDIRNGHGLGWWQAPDEAQRAVLEVVTGGLLARIGETTDETLAASIRREYSASASRHYAARTVSFIAPHGGKLLAEAYQAPSNVWALRWFARHAEQIIAWQVSNLRAWAAGTPGTVLPGQFPTVSDALPKNPGKRRLAVMEPYGCDYHDVLDALARELATDAPEHPVPDLRDVTETLRTTPEGS